MVNEFDSLAPLEGAYRRGLPWQEIARQLTAAEAANPNAIDPSGRTIVKVAAALSGYPVNKLRQMQRALNTLESLPGLVGTERQRISMLPFSFAELLSRVAQLDPQAATEALGAFFERAMTVRRLSDRYHQLRDKARPTSPIFAGKTAARQFEEAVYKLLAKSLSVHLPGYPTEPQLIKWRVPFDYASPTFAAAYRRPDGYLEVDGIDCHVIHWADASDPTRQRTLRIATESTFFRKFWIIVSDKGAAEQFKKRVDELALRNVEVRFVEGKDKLTLVAPSIEPSVTDGSPDPRDHAQGAELDTLPIPDRRVMLLPKVSRFFNKV